MSLKMVVAHFWGALVLSLSTASWLRRGRWCTAQVPGEACYIGFPDENSAVLIPGGAWDLTATDNGCGNFWRSSGYFERHFLAPAQTPKAGGTDPLSCWHRLTF